MEEEAIDENPLDFFLVSDESDSNNPNSDIDEYLIVSTQEVE